MSSNLRRCNSTLFKHLVKSRTVLAQKTASKYFTMCLRGSLVLPTTQGKTAFQIFRVYRPGAMYPLTHLQYFSLNPEEKSTSFMKSMKEKGFGLPTDVHILKQKHSDIPSVEEMRARGLGAVPGLEDLRTFINNNIPANVEELKAMTPTWNEVYKQGRANMPDIEEVKKTPFPAFALGTLGTLPFIYPPWKFLLAGYILPGWEFFQLMYGSCVLAFLGGVRWGLILKAGATQQPALRPDWGNLSLGIAPPMIAIFAMLLPPLLANLVLIVGLSSAAYVDLLTPIYPKWYKAFRVILTVAALSCLGLTLFFKMILSRKPTKNKKYE